MSRIGLSAVVLALFSATAASACCFFKCCFKSSAADGPVKTIVTTPLIRINSIDAQAPVSNNIPNECGQPKVDVIVELDFEPGPSSPELNVTDDGPRIAAAVVAKASTRPYRPRRVVKLPRPKTVVAPAPGPSPGPAPIPGPIPDPNFIWQAIYTIDVDKNHNYRAYATGSGVSSSTVTFRTRP
jgi:hypothetical protein